MKSDLAIAALIRSRMAELGLSRGEFVKRLGYKNIAKGMPISAPAMSTSKRTLTAAWEAGDLQAAVAAFRQDIVFHSPIPATVGDEVRGLPTLAKILQTAFTCLGMPQNVEGIPKPGRQVHRHIRWCPRRQSNPNRYAGYRGRPGEGGKHSRVHATVASGPVPDALWELPASKARQKRLTNSAQLMEPDACP
jgi:hypothetical protein